MWSVKRNPFPSSLHVHCHWHVQWEYPHNIKLNGDGGRWWSSLVIELTILWRTFHRVSTCHQHHHLHLHNIKSTNPQNITIKTSSIDFKGDGVRWLAIETIILQEWSVSMSCTPDTWQPSSPVTTPVTKHMVALTIMERAEAARELHANCICIVVACL